MTKLNRRCKPKANSSRSELRNSFSNVSSSNHRRNRFGRINHFLRVLRVLRVLRSFRALRVLRTIRFVQPLHTIVKTCSKALPAMTTITFIMIIITCIAAIIARNLFGDICPESFDNLVRTVYSLFVLLTLDDWYSIYQRCAGRDYASWQLVFCLIYIFIINFILLNLLMAVLGQPMRNVEFPFQSVRFQSIAFKTPWITTPRKTLPNRSKRRKSTNVSRTT